MNIKFIDYKNTLYWLLMLLSIGLYSCTKKISAHTEISDTSVSVILQDSHACFKYKNTSKGIDWNIAVMISTNSTTRNFKVVWSAGKVHCFKYTN